MNRLQCSLWVRFFISSDLSNESHFSSFRGQNVTNTIPFIEQMRGEYIVSSSPPMTVIPTQRLAPVIFNRNSTVSSPSLSPVGPYWNQTSFYMNLGLLYRDQSIFLSSSNPFHSSSVLLHPGSSYSILTSVLANEREWSYHVYRFNDSW